MGRISSALLALAGVREHRSGELSLFENPAKWMRDLFMGEPADSGVQISERSAMSLPVAWRCVNNIAEDTAKLPVRIARVDGKGTRAFVRDHPAWHLLNRMANPLMPAYFARETVMAFAAGWGNGYAEIVRSNAGKPAELWPLPPDFMTVRWVFVNGKPRLQYEYASPITGKLQIFTPRDILHIRGPGDGLVGYSPVRLLRNSLGLAKATETFGSKLFARGLRPSGIVKHPKVLKGDAARNLRESIESKYGGEANAFRVMLLEEGMDWISSTIAPEDAQFLETRAFQVEEICRIWRMPPHKVQKLDRSTNNNIEHQGIEYGGDTLGPWMKRAESEYHAKLFEADEAELEIEHDDARLMRGDFKSRAEGYNLAINAGWMNGDEARSREGMNPIPDGTGAQYLVPSTMVTREGLEDREEAAAAAVAAAAGAAADGAVPEDPLDEDSAPAGADPAQESSPQVLNVSPVINGVSTVRAERLPVLFRGMATAMLPAVEPVLVRLVRLECDRCRQAVRKTTPAAWAAEHYPEHELHLRGELMAIAETAVHQIRLIAPDVAVPGAQDLARRASEHVCSGARAAMEATGNVEALLEGWRTGRAAADARAIVNMWADLLAAPLEGDQTVNRSASPSNTTIENRSAVAIAPSPTTVHGQAGAADREKRAISSGRIELRDNGEGKMPTITGYAAVFNSPTQMWDMEEVVLPGAFDECLASNPDVRCMIEHEGGLQLLGRTVSGTLKLSVDSKGLRYECTPPNTSAGRDVVELIRRGDMTGSSFGFICRAETWERVDNNPNIRYRRGLQKVDLIDVSPVTFPQYDDADVAVRKIQERRPDFLEAASRDALARLALLEAEIAQAA